MAVELVYAGTMLVPFYLPRHYATPLLDLGKLTAYSVSAGLTFAAATAVLFAAYYAAYRVVHGAGGAGGGIRPHGGVPRGGLVIVLFGLLFSATLALVYPYGAADIFDYTLYGRIVARYGANPFLRAPAEFAGDPFLPYVAWPHLPFTYGPLWAALSAGLSYVGGESLLANLLLYKGLAIAFYLASLLLIHSILRRLAPRYAPAGLLLFAWNPLVVTETAANGHNDVVMMALVLLAIRLALVGDARWRPLALAGTVASALVKFATAMLAPLFVASIWRQGTSTPGRLSGLGAGVIAAAGLTAAAYMPFWQGPATLAVQQRDALFTASIPALIKLTLESRLGVPDARLVGLVFLAAFGVYCLIEAWRLAPGVAALVAAGYRVTLIYLLFACLWFQPWYLIWLLALAAIRPVVDIAHLSMLFSFTATMNYFVFDYVWIWNAERLDFIAVQFIAVATIYTLPLAYGLWLLRGYRWAQRGEVVPSR